MGLFGGKEFCSICGNKLGSLNKVSLNDGIICKDCLSKCGSLSKISTLKDFDVRTKKYSLDEEKYKSLKPSCTVANYLNVYNEERLWCSPSLASKKVAPDMFSFDDVIDYELIEDGASITKGGLGAAAAGGILFGAAGAIVGGGLGKKQRDTVNKMSIRISTKDPYIPHVEIVLFNNLEAKRNGIIYKGNKEFALNILSLLDQISVGSPIPETKSPAGLSAADEIMKYKQLLDSGALTQDEFNAKKKQLLGID